MKNEKFTSLVFFFFLSLVYQNVLLRSDKIVTVVWTRERPKDSVIIWKARPWVGVVMFLSTLAGIRLHFIPHMGLIAVFKIFQLLCHVRLC